MAQYTSPNIPESGSDLRSAEPARPPAINQKGTPLRIALVGLGKVVQDNYLPFLSQQPDVELGVFNRTRETAVATASRYGATHFDSLADLVAWQPTSVLVLTSETCRYEYARQLIELGVSRMFLEKPLVASRGQAHVSQEDFERGRELLHLARERKCETAMVFNYRFFQQTVFAKKQAAERKLGKVIHAVAQVHYACWSHCIDLIRCFAGDLVEITAISGTELRTSEEIKTTALDVGAAFRMKDGATGTILGTSGMKWQHPLYELILTFENGRLHMRDLDGTIEILDGHGDFVENRSLTRHSSRWQQYEDSFGYSLSSYLDSLRQGTPPPISGLEGLLELQFEAALKRSISERRLVDVQKEYPL